MKEFKGQIIFLLFFLCALSFFQFEPRFLLSQLSTYIFLVVIGFYGLWIYFARPYKELLRRWKIPLITVFITFMVLSVYSPNLTAQWGVIDDHEIMTYLGTDAKMSFAELPGLFQKSEAFLPGVVLRYRPVYQLFRLFETALWDDHPQAWYATRLVMFIFFLVVVWWATSKIAGDIGGGIFTFFVFSYDFWRDILARLGPSEAYVVLGLGLFILFFTKIWLVTPKANPSWKSWMGLVLGSLIAIGSKENVMVLVVPIICLLVWIIAHRRITKASIVSFCVMISFTMFVGWAVFSATAKAGHDVYAQSTQASNRVQTLLVSIKTHQSKKILTTLGVAGVLFAFTLLKHRDRKLLTIELTFVAGLLFLLFIFVSQFVFYNGNWPDHNRYDFPGLLFEVGYYLLGIWYLIQLLQWLKLPKELTNGVKWGILCGVMALAIMRGLVSTLVDVKLNAQRTQAHTSHIKKVAAQLKENPEIPFVIESHNVWDYEPVFSTKIFLRAQGVTNPFYLRLHGYTSKSVSIGLEQQLATQLEEISLKGNDSYRPLSEFNSTNSCFSLFLSGETKTECQKIQ